MFQGTTEFVHTWKLGSHLGKPSKSHQILKICYDRMQAMYLLALFDANCVDPQPMTYAG